MPQAEEPPGMEIDEGNVGPEPEIIPAELAGRWIVWSADALRIIGHGKSPTEAIHAATEKAGPLQYVPTLVRRPIGQPVASDS